MLVLNACELLASNMIKTKVAFLEGRLLSSQSEKFLKIPNWLKKSRPSQKPLLFYHVNRLYMYSNPLFDY